MAAEVHLIHDMAGELERARKELDSSLAMCPITRERIEDPVLASDGILYERRALAAWLEGEGSAQRAHTSPVTRQPIRPEVVRCSRESLLLSLLSHDFPSPNELLVPRQTQAGIALTHSGSALCKQWKTELGVVVRMLLNWNDDDMVEWWFPIDSSGQCMTYPSALPPQLEHTLSLEIQNWIRSGPTPSPVTGCLVTAHFRRRGAHSQGFATLEELLCQV
jgi:hypothetical protein